MNSISDFLDLFAVAAVVKIYQNGTEAYSGSVYKIPKQFLYIKLTNFKVCFENNRIVYKFWV